MANCTACENELRPVDRFCSQCGVAAPVPGEPWRRGGPAPWSQPSAAPASLPGQVAGRHAEPLASRVRFVEPSRSVVRKIGFVLAVLVAGVATYWVVRAHTAPAAPSHLAAYMAHGGIAYAPRGLHYRVALPVHPAETTKIDAPGGRRTTLHVAVVADPQYVMQVSEESVPGPSAHADVYDYLHQAAIRQQGATATNAHETRTTLDGLPIVETATTSSGWQFDTATIYSGGRVYRIAVHTRSGGSAVLTRMLRSFRVTKTS